MFFLFREYHGCTTDGWQANGHLCFFILWNFKGFFADKIKKCAKSLVVSK